MKSFYAVLRGRTPGIYTTWEECNAQVSGYTNNRFRGFPTKSEAIQWLKKMESAEKQSQEAQEIQPICTPKKI